MLIEIKKRRKTYAVIFLSAQRSWGCIFWATDKQTGLESLLSRRAWLGHPAVGGGAFRLPFSIIPRWVTLWTPKEIKQNDAERQVDPTERLIFENFFEDSNHRCSLLMLSVFLKLCHTKKPRLSLWLCCKMWHNGIIGRISYQTLVGIIVFCSFWFCLFVCFLMCVM